MISTFTVLLFADPSGAGASLDVTCYVDEISIHHGREDSSSQPEAATATLDLSADNAVDPLPSAIEIGAVIRVYATLAGDPPAFRFAGRISDVNAGWEEAGVATPDRVVTQVIAVSPLADLARRVVGDVPFPQELDGPRVARVMALAGVTLDPAFSDPGTCLIIPRDVDSQPALDVGQSTAESAGGLIWHTRSGEVRYADADHRRNLQPSLALDSCDLLVSPNWRRSTEGLVNRVSIGYGVVPEEGEQPRYVADRPESVAKYGRYELSASTELALLADATRMGNLLLTRNSSPVWVLSDLPIAVKDLDLAQTRALLGLDVHSLLDVTGLPTAGTVPTSAALWVEGWDETLRWGDHEMVLVVSGFCRTSPAPRWNDVDPAMTWDSAPGSWDDASCLGPSVNRGRWDDLPASTRWDQIPPATTWNNWK
jgi:hypothetical protein